MKEFVEASAAALEVVNRVVVEAIKSAMGIAISRASGFIANFGTDAHYLVSAIACRDGYLAVALAQRGMTGTSNIEGWLASLFAREELLPISNIVRSR